MNPHAILALLSDLYAQLTTSQEQIAALEEELRRVRAEGTVADSDADQND